MLRKLIWNKIKLKQKLILSRLDVPQILLKEKDTSGKAATDNVLFCSAPFF
jgi:hypothetical protein